MSARGDTEVRIGTTQICQSLLWRLVFLSARFWDVIAVTGRFQLQWEGPSAYVCTASTKQFIPQQSTNNAYLGGFPCASTWGFLFFLTCPRKFEWCSPAATAARGYDKVARTQPISAKRQYTLATSSGVYYDLWSGLPLQATMLPLVATAWSSTMIHLMTVSGWCCFKAGMPLQLQPNTDHRYLNCNNSVVLDQCQWSQQIIQSDTGRPRLCFNHGVIAVR